MGTELTDAEAFAMLDDLDISQYAGQGNENVSSQDLAIPYINILQKMSPQCDEDDNAYIAGARPGMFFQNVNLLTWKGDEGLEIVPVSFTRVVNEWIPREKGGGLVTVHEPSVLQSVEWELNEKRIPVRKDNGNVLIDTAQHIVLYQFPLNQKFEPAMVSMKSTALKKSRLWNSLIAQMTIPGTERQAPRWLFKWVIKTVREQKDDNTWYNWEFVKGDIVDKDTFLRAEKLYKTSKSGLVRGAENTDDIGDEIPF